MLDNNLYFVDSHNYVVRKVTVSSGIISTIAGNRQHSFTSTVSAATSTSYSPLTHSLTYLLTHLLTYSLTLLLTLSLTLLLALSLTLLLTLLLALFRTVRCSSPNISLLNEICYTASSCGSPLILLILLANL